MIHWLLAASLACLLFQPASADATSKSDVFRHAKAATALIVAVNDSGRSVSVGSGFFVNPDGLLVTNAHVIEDSTSLYLYTQDQIVTSDPEVVAMDSDLDLAALRVPVGKLGPVATLSLAADFPVDGTDAIAVGYPRITDILQMGFALHPTVGAGTVSGVSQGRSRKSGHHARFIQTTGVLNFGNSGGPLVNLETGEAAGMVVTTVPYSERARDRSGAAIGSVSMKSGIGYSIPAPVIRDWLSGRHLPMGAPGSGGTTPPPLGADAHAGRSFATGHVLQTIATVLHQDSDLLGLAIYHYEAAAALRPDLPWIIKNLARAYASSGRWNDAVGAYQKAIERDPQDADLLSDIGFAWQRAGLKERAAESYRAALRLNPSSGRAHNNLGQLLFEMGRLEDAIVEFREAVENDPELSLAVYNLGLALEAKGLSSEALEAWEAFLTAPKRSQEPDDWTNKIRDGLARLRTSAKAPAPPAVVVTSSPSR